MRKRPYPHTVRALADALDLGERARDSLLAAVPRRDEALPSRGDVAARRAPETLPVSTLPRPTTPLLGRECELDRIGSLMAQPDTRMLTFTGIGGVGKTRLAVEAVRASLASGLSPDGVAFVGLAPIEDPALVAPAVLGSLGAAVPEGLGPYEALAGHLGVEEFLLVLDNLEHLLEAAPELAGLMACLDLTVLVTSRAPLRVWGRSSNPCRRSRCRPLPARPRKGRWRSRPPGRSSWSGRARPPWGSA